MPAPLSPNPPVDTDGRRENSGRVVRELPGRWPGIQWGRWEVGKGSSVVAQGPYGRLRTLGRARWRGEDAARDTRTGWRELAGTLGWPVDGSVADGRRQAGSGIACSRARARLNCSSQGQRWGRCRVRRRAERVIRPAREKNRRRRVLVVTIRSPRPIRAVQRQVVRHHLYRQPRRRWRRSAPRGDGSARRRTSGLGWHSRSRRGGDGRPPVPGSLRPGR